MALRALTGSRRFGSGAPIVGARVTVTLYAGVGQDAVYDDDGVYLLSSSVLTDNAGNYSIRLMPNSSISPTGTVYKVTTVPPDGEPSVIHVVMPDADSVDADVLSEVPGALPSQALAAHAALTSAHGVSGDLVGSVSPVVSGLSARVVVLGQTSWGQALADAAGLAGDGTTDDTAAMQGYFAAAAGGRLVVPAGSYLIDSDVSRSGGLSIPSNTTVELLPGATILAKPGSTSSYQVVRMVGVANAHLVGRGHVRGERGSHVGSTGEQGHCVAILGSSDCSVQGVRIADAWGDGIYLGVSGGTGNTDISIRDVSVSGVRRNGMSITSAVRCAVDRCTFEDTNGTAPQAGLDIEPNPGGYATDIKITGCSFLSNVSYGMLLAHVAGAVISGVAIDGCLFESNGAGYVVTGEVPNVYLSGSVARSNDEIGFYVHGGHTLMRDVVAYGNGTHGILLEGATLGAGVDGATCHGNGQYGISVGSGDSVPLVRAVRAYGNATGDVPSRANIYAFSGLARFESCVVLPSGVAGVTSWRVDSGASAELIHCGDLSGLSQSFVGDVDFIGCYGSLVA